MPWELPRLVGPDLAAEARKLWDPVQYLADLCCSAPTVHSKIALLEIRAYMMPRLLIDSDWASMAHSLELRVPFVDKIVLAALGPANAGSMPPTKADMMAIPKKPLPHQVMHREKTGFQVPVHKWLAKMNGVENQTKSLRDWSKFVYARFLGAERFEELKLT